MGDGDGALTGRAAVFLDRDGVLVEPVVDDLLGTHESPYRPADVALVTGAGEAIRRLRGGGWLLVGVSNQPAAAKGNASLAQLEEVAAHTRSLLGAQGADLDDWRYCHHHPQGVVASLSGACGCRKPAPGMLFDAAAQHGIDLSRSWMVGDSGSDVEAGVRAGCRTVVIEHLSTAHRRGEGSPATVNASSLARAVELITSYGVPSAGTAEPTRT